MGETYDITIAEGIKGAKPRKNAKKHKNRDVSWFYLGLAGQIGYTIAIPLVIGSITGKFFGHALIGLIVGAGISGIGFVKIIQKLL